MSARPIACAVRSLAAARSFTRVFGACTAASQRDSATIRIGAKNAQNPPRLATKTARSFLIPRSGYRHVASARTCSSQRNSHELIMPRGTRRRADSAWRKVSSRGFHHAPLLPCV